MTVIQLVPVAISLLAFGFSLYTYCKHDIKIKEQNDLINQFTLEKFEKEIEQEKRAIIEANVIKGERSSSRIIKVYNKGKAAAKNVVVTFEDANLLISEYPSPIDILPQHSIDIKTTVFYGTPSIIKINFEWEDGAKLDNRGSQVLQLY